MNKLIMMTAASATALMLVGCDEPRESADHMQKRQQEQLSMQGNMSVGMPAIANFSEKRMMKDILEMRDKMVPTYTYLAGEMNGSIGEKVCDSLGYGLSGATQFTNPQKIADRTGESYAILPQADPNGLFSPASTEGTWVMCKVPNSDQVAPQYIEPRIIVLTYPKETRK